MIREVEPLLPSARLISLDHDLEPAEGETEDPGDGIDVARFLAARPPVCPVIVHSSNGTRSDWMIGEFELGGWTYKRVAPSATTGSRRTGEWLSGSSSTGLMADSGRGLDSRHVQDVEKSSKMSQVPVFARSPWPT